MDRSTHTINALFAQLGMPNDDAYIDQFIRTHTLSNQDIKLSEASFWNDSQANFIKECLDCDSDWSEVVDDLNTRLHS
ncbi:DUF2789 domain-containing protein [Amphritea sp. 2_MG-2023]|uniref:DUF2789 domain-containing protein n=1 Tax=Amphritea TaxID=515417 RepID=UPI001C07DD6C|nr:MULTISPECIES: DUF2789 domain-containing protein [Amphritea]MBU2965414.1 DUF2789 domain-containing protein [Amphritea atlantica]MDO6420704.1 DUF2789 domain-containing protein [Amphritea sp. 2_MG-2023]